MAHGTPVEKDAPAFLRRTFRVSSGGVAISTTEIGTERAMKAAILLGRAGAIRVTSE
jgi:hypothetical protein